VTPFMARVAGLGGGQPPGEPPVMLSEPKPWAVGLDDQVTLRSLAEQLVCEANAVLSAAGQRIALDDELGGQALSFTITYQGRSARIATRREAGVARASLDHWGPRPPQLVELAGPAALEDLIAALVSADIIRDDD
jgi:hypothetical protein